MDYSLLLIIEYNPKYVEMYPEKFVHDGDGSIVYPVKEKPKRGDSSLAKS